MAYQAVLFDLDGTLINTARDMRLAANKVLREEGAKAISDEIALQFSSHGAIGLLQQGLGARFEHYCAKHLRTRFLTHYSQAIYQHSRLYCGIETLLYHLSSQRIRWGVVTNKPEHHTRALLRHFAVFQHCHCVIAGDTLDERKPHPKPMLHAASTLAVAPSQCIYVGDAERDIQAGQAANMYTIAALWGFIPHSEQPARWQAHHYCMRSEQLKDTLVHLIPKFSQD